MGRTHECLHFRAVRGASGVVVARPLEGLALKVGMQRLALLCCEVLGGVLSRAAPLHEHLNLNPVVVAMLSALAAVGLAIDGKAKVRVPLVALDRLQRFNSFLLSDEEVDLELLDDGAVVVILLAALVAPRFTIDAHKVRVALVALHRLERCNSFLLSVRCFSIFSFSMTRR